MTKPVRKPMRGTPKPTKVKLPIRRLTFNTEVFKRRFETKAKEVGWVGNGTLPTQMLMPFVLSRLSKQNGMGKLFRAENRSRKIFESVVADVGTGKIGRDVMVNLCYRAHLTRPQAELIINELREFAKRVPALERYAQNLSLQGTNPNLKN
ncbi:Uncharacterised protein [uncultured archaeon]|nr:Uncharacterised protein [uncultured archaeon]